MENILRMLLPAFQPSTSVAIVGLAWAATVALVLVIGAARRSGSYGRLPMMILAIGLSASALASWLGVRMFAAVFRDVTANGGGIGAISSGIWESAQIPWTAAWIALIASFVAAMFLGVLFGGDQTATDDRRSRPLAVGLLMTAGLVFGLAPLLAFRPAIAFVWRAITPGTAIPAARVLNYLLAYEVTTAACFLAMIGIVVALSRMSRRSITPQPVAPMIILALLLTVAVSATTAARLRTTSARFHEVAHHGSVSALER